MNEIITQLIDLQQKPEPFTPGEPLFWNDPHISKQMLKVHLDPNMDAASRKPEIIERSIKWMIETLGLSTGASVLDLGCGPGLYASHFARAGMHVTGVDFSQSSIKYARQYASDNDLQITYRFQNYLELTDENKFDVVLLIYGDFCPLSPEQRSTLLANVSRALKPEGNFVFDVSTREHRKRYGNRCDWHTAESGFWKPGPHLVLESGFDWPERSIWLDQYIVIEADGKLSVFRNWFQDYTPETISEEIGQGGFIVESVWGDLTGTPYTPESEWIGLISSKRR